MRFLVTGGCGFLGTNLSAHILERGEELVILDNFFRVGSRNNLEFLKSLGRFTLHEVDVQDATRVERIVKDFSPEVVFHLAGQVAMTTSIENPRLDFSTNVIGGFNVLEAVRLHAPEACVFYSSTNKVYGDLEYIEYQETPTRFVTPQYPRGFDEQLALDFRSPYGCSKGATDQYMMDWYRIFGVRTVVFRHSSIFGGRQYPTFDQGWIGWFIRQALEKKKDPTKVPFTISGTGKQVRDVLFASDIVACYFEALEHIASTAGHVFNIGGGMENSMSLLELFGVLEGELGIQMEYERLPQRVSDQKVFVADISKATSRFGWKPEVSRVEGIKAMCAWLEGN